MPNYVSGSSAEKTATAIAYMMRQVGKPYIWGGVGPTGYDCSGLGYAAFRTVNVNVTRTTYTMALQGFRVERADVQPGDFIFPRADLGHMFYYIGSGRVVEAPRTGLDIRVRDWPSSESAYMIRRLVHPSNGVEVDPSGLKNEEGDSNSFDLFRALEPLAAFATQLTSPQLWVRYGMVIGGVALIIIALVMFSSDEITKVVKKVL